MKLAIIGSGAMGSVTGGLLAKAGHDVIFIDVRPELIAKLNSEGLRIDQKGGGSEIIPVRATADPGEVGTVDLALIFVKCYHTAAAVQNGLPMIGPETTVLTLQNGWGNAARISALTGPEKLLAGVCYHSATVLGPGHVLHAGRGMTFIGELDGRLSARLERIAHALNEAGIEVTATATVMKEIWSKLALNAATLPTSSALRLPADRLLDTTEMQDLMRDLLTEVITVARAQGIDLTFDERWTAITGLLRKLAPNTKGSMLQDVENRRQTEIDVINGAIVAAGDRLGIATPYNRAMVSLIKALEQSFLPKGINQN